MKCFVAVGASGPKGLQDDLKEASMGFERQTRMAPDTLHARLSNAESFRSDEDDSVLFSRLRMVIYCIGIAAALVAITV